MTLKPYQIDTIIELLEKHIIEVVTEHQTGALDIDKTRKQLRDYLIEVLEIEEDD